MVETSPTLICIYAAIDELMQTEEYPTQIDLSECRRRNGSDERILLQSFKHWRQKSSSKDKLFSYRCEMLNMYGPLLAYENSISYGCCLGREVGFLLILSSIESAQVLMLTTVFIL